MSLKINDSRESSVTQKTDLDDPQQKDTENNRRNTSGYSWWKWSRRSTESNSDKKSPPKELIDDQLSQQNVERVDEMKEVINDLDSMTLDEGGSVDPSTEYITEPQTVSELDLSADNADAAKNDDSISSELADISKSSFYSEKYRKTLRLTSEQIVRHHYSKLSMYNNKSQIQFICSIFEIIIFVNRIASI